MRGSPPATSNPQTAGARADRGAGCLFMAAGTLPAGPRSVTRRGLSLLTVFLAACGGGGKGLAIRPPVSSAQVPPPSTALPTTTPSAGSQTVTVTPDSGLTSGQLVTVTGSGFSTNEALVVTECAAKGASTGPGDCNLVGMATTASDATGHVQVDVVVTKGPFGANAIVCSAAQPCLVSVTQATLSPTEEADAFISFR